jgi:hypothetical protein
VVAGCISHNHAPINMHACHDVLLVLGPARCSTVNGSTGCATMCRPFSGAIRSWSPTDDTQAADAGGQGGPSTSSTADADAQRYARVNTPGSPGSTVRYSNMPAYNSKGQRLHSSSGRGVAFNLAQLPGELPRPQTAAASAGGAGGQVGCGSGSSGGFTGRSGLHSARTKRPQTSSGQTRNPIFL